MDLIEGFDSNYRFVLVTARRARQLLSGARPQVESVSRKPCKIAQQEVRAGKVQWEMPEVVRTPAEVASEMLDHTLITPDLG
jgi:DNA-directed RNA polymerase subunit omega